MNVDISKHDITAVILSGGAGQRLGGVDKGLEQFKGKALIEHVIDNVSDQVNDVMLCVNRNHDRYKKYGYPLVSDTLENKSTTTIKERYQGPLAGITVTLDALDKPLTKNKQHCLLVSPCDSPNLPNDYVAKLTSSMVSNNASSVVVYDGRRTQNLHCLIHSSAWSSLQDFYNEGGRAMHSWHKKNGSVEVNFSDQAAFFLNLNTADMLN